MSRHVIPPTIKDAIRQPFAFPGGYPKFLICNDGGALCCDCGKREFRLIAQSTVKGIRDGWLVSAADINWEDIALFCDHCGKAIPAAYDSDNREESHHA